MENPGVSDACHEADDGICTTAESSALISRIDGEKAGFWLVQRRRHLHIKAYSQPNYLISNFPWSAFLIEQKMIRHFSDAISEEMKDYSFKLLHAGFVAVVIPSHSYVGSRTERLGVQPTHLTAWFFTQPVIAGGADREDLKRLSRAEWGGNGREWTCRVELSSQHMIHCHVRNLVNSSQFNYD